MGLTHSGEHGVRPYGWDLFGGCGDFFACAFEAEFFDGVAEPGGGGAIVDFFAGFDEEGGRGWARGQLVCLTEGGEF